MKTSPNMVSNAGKAIGPKSDLATSILGPESNPTWQESCFSTVLGFAFALPLRQESPIFLGEIIALIIVVGAVLLGQLPRIVNRTRISILVVTLPVMFLGYALSDMYASSQADQMLKTWARLLFQDADILAVAYLLWKKPGKFDCLAGGFALGCLAGGFLRPEGMIWKFDGAQNLDILGALFAKRMSRTLGASLLFAIGGINLILDCRNPAAVAILAGSIYLVGSAARYVKNLGSTQIVVIVGLSLALMSVAWTFVSQKSLERQHMSSVGRAAEIEVVLDACITSPLVGHGSDYISTQILDRIEQRNVDAGESRRNEFATMSVGGHSEVLQAWFEGGLLGPSMFLVMLAFTIKSLRNIVSESAIRMADPLLLTVIFLLGWDILFSPFSGSHRCSNAIYFGGVIVARMTVRRPLASRVRFAYPRNAARV